MRIELIGDAMPYSGKDQYTPMLVEMLARLVPVEEHLKNSNRELDPYDADVLTNILEHALVTLESVGFERESVAQICLIDMIGRATVAQHQSRARETSVLKLSLDGSSLARLKSSAPLRSSDEMVQEVLDGLEAHLKRLEVLIWTDRQSVGTQETRITHSLLETVLGILHPMMTTPTESRHKERALLLAGRVAIIKFEAELQGTG